MENIFSEEEIDFLTEMANISSGNAATALEQLLRCPVNINVPRMLVLNVQEAYTLLESYKMPFAGVRMEILGDFTGDLFLLMELSQRKNLLKIISGSLPFRIKPGEIDLTVLEEVGNIIAGTYLMAIHDFCKLNILHTVPVLAIDTLKALLDETIADESLKSSLILLIDNEFSLGESNVKAVLIIAVVLSLENRQVLLDSIKKAREMLGIAAGDYHLVNSL